MAGNMRRHYREEDVHVKPENVLQNYEDEDEEEVPVEVPLTIVKAEPIDPEDYEDMNTQVEPPPEDPNDDRMITDDYPSQYPETSIKAEPSENEDCDTPQVPLLNVRVELEEESRCSSSPQQAGYDPLDLLKSASQSNILSDDDVSLVRLKYRMKRILNNPSEKVQRRKSGRKTKKSVKLTDPEICTEPSKSSSRSKTEAIPKNDKLPVPKRREVRSEKIVKETPEQREKRLLQKREYKLRKKATETPEERELRLKKQREWESKRLASLSPEDRELHLLRRRETQYRKRTGREYFQENDFKKEREESPSRGVYGPDNVERYKKFIDKKMWNMCQRRFVNRTI